LTGKWPAIVIGLVMLAAACTAGQAATRSDTAGRTELVVFAAASLKDAMDRAMATYEARSPSVNVIASIDSSSALRTQIEQGAPADLFLSADLTNPERLTAAGVASPPVVRIATNELVIAVPPDNPGRLVDAFGIAADGVTVVAAGDGVPITVYATKLLNELASIPNAPPGFIARYESNVISREDNVRAVAAKLELGEADAGIIYRTDALGSTGLRIVPLPAGVGVSASYGGVVIDGARHAAEARAFLEWLVGPEGQGILEGFGFEAAP
jgi:molybdate transport system substrate-binding protein